MSSFGKACSFIHSVLSSGSFPSAYCINAMWHRGDQLVALLQTITFKIFDILLFKGSITEKCLTTYVGGVNREFLSFKVPIQRTTLINMPPSRSHNDHHVFIVTVVQRVGKFILQPESCRINS